MRKDARLHAELCIFFLSSFFFAILPIKTNSAKYCLKIETGADGWGRVHPSARRTLFGLVDTDRHVYLNRFDQLPLVQMESQAIAFRRFSVRVSRKSDVENAIEDAGLSR